MTEADKKLLELVANLRPDLLRLQIPKLIARIEALRATTRYYSSGQRGELARETLEADDRAAEEMLK